MMVEKEKLKKDWETFKLQYNALMHKNFLISWRNKKMTFTMMLAPLFFMLLLYISSTILTNPGNVLRIAEENTGIPSCISVDHAVENCISLAYVYNVEGYDLSEISSRSLSESECDDIMLSLQDEFPESLGVDGEFPRMVKFESVDSLLNESWVNEDQVMAAVVFYPNPSPFFNLSDTGNPPGETAFSVMYNMSALSTYGFQKREIVSSIHFQTYKAILQFLGERDIGLDPSDVLLEESFTPFPKVLTGPDHDVVSQNGGSSFYMALMANFAMILYLIVQEKENGIRQALKSNGLSDLAYWTAWFSWIVLWVLYYTLFIQGVGAIMFSFFRKHNFFVVFLLFFIFDLVMMSFCLSMSIVVQTTKASIGLGMALVIIGGIFADIVSFPFILQILYLDVRWLRLIFQFWPPFNFTKILQDIGNHANLNKTGFKWSYLQDRYPLGEFSLPPARDSFLLLLMNGALFFGLFLLMIQLLPSENGYLLRKIRAHRNKNETIEVLTERARTGKQSRLPDVDVQEAANLKDPDSILRVMDLHKNFGSFLVSKKKHVKAVKGLSYEFANNTVFALLGHNGAGKTTTINVLTGIYPPTSGEAVMLGKRVSKDLSHIQNDIGVCPQSNILWEKLTAAEHLDLLARIKGFSDKEKRSAEVETRLKEVLLWDSKDVYAGGFSGGMKRRLTLGCSCVGNPKILFLDEPTTGLDPKSRRHIWKALIERKKERCTILTTHSMEEADALGDVLGIMADGQLKCLGNPLHLKNKYGKGYRLSINVVNIDLVSEVEALIAELLPEVTLVTSTSGRMAYGIEDINTLMKFFSFLEKEGEKLTIRDWGFSLTSLEEVFLSVTKKEKKKLD